MLREMRKEHVRNFKRRVSVAQLFGLVQSKCIKFSLCSAGGLKMNNGGVSIYVLPSTKNTIDPIYKGF